MPLGPGKSSDVIGNTCAKPINVIKNLCAKTMRKLSHYIYLKIIKSLYKKKRSGKEEKTFGPSVLSYSGTGGRHHILL